MKKIVFPAPFKHEHIIRNVNDLYNEKLSMGQRAADRVAQIVGSWKFIIIQTLILAVWAMLNVTAWVYHWDPYPFILMNLFLSLQAAGNSDRKVEASQRKIDLCSPGQRGSRGFGAGKQGSETGLRDAAQYRPVGAAGWAYQ